MRYIIGILLVVVLGASQAQERNNLYTIYDGDNRRYPVLLYDSTFMIGFDNVGEESQQVLVTMSNVYHFFSGLAEDFLKAGNYAKTMAKDETQNISSYHYASAIAYVDKKSYYSPMSLTSFVLKGEGDTYTLMIAAGSMVDKEDPDGKQLGPPYFIVHSLDMLSSMSRALNTLAAMQGESMNEILYEDDVKVNIRYTMRNSKWGQEPKDKVFFTVDNDGIVKIGDYFTGYIYDGFVGAMANGLPYRVIKSGGYVIEIYPQSTDIRIDMYSELGNILYMSFLI